MTTIPQFFVFIINIIISVYLANINANDWKCIGMQIPKVTYYLYHNSL